MPKVHSLVGSGRLEIFLKIYFPKTSYEHFDSSWIKNPGKSCTPHSRVSNMCRLRLLVDRITALRGSGVWEPTKPGLRVLVCAASGDSKVLEDTSRGPERSRPPFRGRRVDVRHTRASIGGGTRFVTPRVSTNGTPARVFTAGRAIRGEARPRPVSPASGNCSGTRGTSARHTGARAVFPGFKPLKPRYHGYPVGRRRTSHAQRRDQLGASLVPPTIFPKAPIECSHSAHSQEHLTFPCRSTRDGHAARGSVRRADDRRGTRACPPKPAVPLSPTLTVTHHPSLTYPSTERTLAGGQHGALPDVKIPIHRGPARLHRGEKDDFTQGEQPGQRRLPRGARDVGRERQHEPVRQCRAVEARVRRRPGVIPRRRG